MNKIDQIIHDAIVDGAEHEADEGPAYVEGYVSEMVSEIRLALEDAGYEIVQA